MTTLLLAVLAQARYVCAVHSFVRELLHVTVPGLVKDSAYVRTDTEFSRRIDRAVSEVSSPEATEADYVRAIVDAACREMADVCTVLKMACHFTGLGKLANVYLDSKRFGEMLMRQNTDKLERVKAIVQKRSGKPVKILMDVAAALKERPGVYDRLAAKDKRKAAADLDKVVGKVSDIVAGAETRLAKKIDKGNSDLAGRVDEVGKKVDGIGDRRRRGRKAKFGEAAREACLTFWEAALEDAKNNYSHNARVKYSQAFNRYRRQLAAHGVDTVKKFKAILHAAQSRDCKVRKKELEAKADAQTRKLRNVV